jgi:LuxR family maltose regulon positive regulatory protein
LGCVNEQGGLGIVGGHSRIQGSEQIMKRAIQPKLADAPRFLVLSELLARNLSNKEIGLTMNIHEDTVKWHVKNLFAKLSAGTRKQVVSRARLMGILAPAS